MKNINTEKMNDIFTEKINIYSFPGFYETILSPENENENENNLNYKDYQNKVGILYIEYIKEYFKKENISFVNNIEFASIFNPKYYNSVNDTLEANININKKKFVGYIEKNKEKIDKYFKDKTDIYNEYNDIEDYIKDTENEITSFDIETILEFILKDLDIEEFKETIK